MNFKKINISQIIFIVLSVMCMVLIFMFSADNGEESSNKSGFIVKIVQFFLGEESNPKIAENLSFIVRKTAHFSIYALLGFLVSGSFALRKLFSKAMWIVLLICFLYACSDEVHQLFVPGRSGHIRDVAIDTSGAFLGIVIFTAFLQNKSKKSE